MAKRQRRRFTGQEKVGVIKRHLVDKIAVSELCDEQGLQPTQFYLWQKQLFENGAKAFEKDLKNKELQAAESRIIALESTVVRRNAALAELLMDTSSVTRHPMEHRERLAGSRGRQ